jgi:hypothetical protein
LTCSAQLFIHEIVARPVRLAILVPVAEVRLWWMGQVIPKLLQKEVSGDLALLRTVRLPDTKLDEALHEIGFVVDEVSVKLIAHGVEKSLPVGQVHMTHVPDEAFEPLQKRFGVRGDRVGADAPNRVLGVTHEGTNGLLGLPNHSLKDGRVVVVRVGGHGEIRENNWRAERTETGAAVSIDLLYSCCRGVASFLGDQIR